MGGRLPPLPHTAQHSGASNPRIIASRPMVSAATRAKTIDLRLLGPVVAIVDGRSAGLGGPRQMAVLARLMLTPGQVVSMGQLVDSVWDGDVPARPEVAVRSYVSNLRRAIEPHRRRRSADSCITSSGAGYTLQVEPGAVDHVRFESLIRSGRTQAAAGEHAAAITDLGDALDLWRGEPCTGLSDSEIFTAYRSQFVQLRETALELLFESQLARGDHLSVVATIEGALAESPLRERLTELAMVAFYRAGRQSEALALGSRLRDRLREELGVEPSPAVADLEVKILNHDESLAAPDDGVGPPGGLGRVVPPPLAPGLAGGVGRSTPAEPARAEGEVVLDGEGSAIEIDARTTADLPVDTTPSSIVSTSSAPPAIVGREVELAALSAVVADVAAGRSASAIVTGEPGIGKTALITAVARQATEAGITVAWGRAMEGESMARWPWAQAIVSLVEATIGRPSSDWWTGLEPLRALGPSVVAALGLPPPAETVEAGGGGDPDPEPAEVMLAVTQLLRRIAATTPLLIVLEDLHWADRQTVTLLRFAASTLTGLPVGLVMTWCPGEPGPGPVSIELRKLARVPSLVRVDLQGLDGRAAAALVERTGRDLSADTALELHQRSGGNPLFLVELLAATGAEDETVEIGRCPNLVDAVRARIEVLGPEADAVLGVAALLRGPFTAEQIAVPCDLAQPEVESILVDCVRRGVLEEVGPGGDRYRFRHPVFAEVLDRGLVGRRRAARHHAIGHHLLAVEGRSYEVCHHLGNGGSDPDRMLAAELALELFGRQPDCTRLGEVDRQVAEVLAIDRRAEDRVPHRLLVDAHLYAAWRAWLDQRGDDWRSAATSAFEAALRLMTGGDDEADEATGGGGGSRLDRLGRSAMALIGFPPYHAGPVAGPGAGVPRSERLSALSRAVALLPDDHVAHWLIELTLVHLEERSERPNHTVAERALQAAERTVRTAARHVPSSDADIVRCAFLERFGERLDPEAQLALMDELELTGAGLWKQLFVTRRAYPVLMSLGRRDEAEQRIHSVWARSKTVGDQLDVAAARALRIMHQVWTGQLDQAEEQIMRGLADWTALGLEAHAVFGSQLFHLRHLQGRPVDPDGTLRDSYPKLRHRARPGRMALLLSEIGDPGRASAYLDSAVDGLADRWASPSDLAELAAAAALVRHEVAGRLAGERLRALGDRLLLSRDGYIVLGPASLLAGLAAWASGDQEEASSLLTDAFEAIKRCGGSVEAVRVLLRTDDDHPALTALGSDPSR